MNSDFIELKLKQEELRRLGHLRCRVVSGSMEPLIGVGEMIEVEALDSIDAIRRFDILVFLGAEGFFCHFAWHITRWSEGPLVSTRSLMNPFQSDVPVPYDRVLGRVRDRKVSALRRLLILVRNLLGRSL